MRVLLISPISSHPQDEGNSERVYQVISHLKSLGHDVFLLYFPIHSFSEPKDLTLLHAAWPDRMLRVPVSGSVRSKGPSISLRYALYRKLLGFGRNLPRGLAPSFYSCMDVLGGTDRWLPRKINDVVDDVVARFKPEAVFCEYVVLSALFDRFGSDVVKVVDTHDKFTDRNRVTAKSGGGPWISFTRSQERRALMRADHVIAIQEEEAAYFRDLIGNNRSIQVVEQLSELPVVTDVSGVSNVFGLIGSPNPFNLEGLEWFYESILPRIRKAVPEAELLLAGSICGRIPKPEGVTEIGFVRDRLDFYNRCRFVINPVRGGTGLKIKSVEALSHARPLVTTRHGASGLLDRYSDGIVAVDAPDSFADACISYLKDQDAALKASRLAIGTAERMRKSSSENLQACLLKPSRI